MTARWTQRNPQWTWLAAVATLLFVDQVSKLNRTGFRGGSTPERIES